MSHEDACFYLPYQESGPSNLLLHMQQSNHSHDTKPTTYNIYNDSTVVEA